MKKFIQIATCLLIALLACSGSTMASEPSDSTKVVRIGWFDSPFNLIDGQGHRSGLSYEYFRRIAANTGWKYEYVSGTWSELYEKLERGEIDILSDVTYTPDRAKKILFSQLEMGKEEFYIIVSGKHPTIRPGYPETLRGKRIGVNKRSVQAEMLKQWLKDNNIEATVIENYYSEEQYIESLYSGEFDAIAAVNAIDNLGKGKNFSLAHIGSCAIHFAIRKDRYDLKQQIDHAMMEINSYNAYFNQDLYRKYFTDINLNLYLTDAEIEWIRKHGTIRIGYRDNYLPFCGTDPETGKVIGLLGDIIERTNTTLAETGIHLEAFPYPQTREAVEAVHNGEVDVEFPCGLSIYSAEKERLFVTDIILESAEMAVMRKNDNFQADRPLRAAVNANNPNYKSMIREQLPHWQMVDFRTTQECLEGVSRGEADLLLISNYRMGVLNRDIERLNLKIVATGSTISFAFSTPEGQPELFSIMSRIAHLMSAGEIRASLANHSQVSTPLTILDFIKENVIGTLLLTGFILLVFFLLLMHSHREHNRAEEASMAKSRFLFSMSHDIRTPMNVILGYTELLKDNIDDNSPHGVLKNHDYLMKIHTAGNFLLSLINNVLEMSRIESGKIELNELPCNRSEVMKNLSTLIEDKVERKNIQVSFIDTVKSEALYCDELKLSEIYLNLLSNCVKYTPEGGSISITCDELKHPVEGWTYIRCVISDTGIGMAPEFLPHIFDDFSRERTATESKVTGTGLGMSIVKRLVDLMNGTITVESEQGKGTTFTLIIPHRIASEQLLSCEVKQEYPDQFNGCPLLLAEDNELNAEIATELLEDHGFHITWVKDGQECLERIQNEPAGTFRLILMDIQMPRMNGYDATRAIRKLSDPIKANIPIVAMTANAFQEDKKNAFKAGMNAHVAKPIDMPLLLRTIASLI